MQRKLFRSLAGMVLCLVSMAGCMETALVGVGATGALAGYKWMEGTLTREYPRSLPEMDQAVQNTCRNLRIKISERRVTPTKATISGVDANGEDVRINMDARPNNITSVGVRMGGFMGNREASQIFHNQLAKELGL
jgi:hypothetical protein